MLTAFYGPQQGVSVTSAADPGVTRTFTSFAAAADEAGLSRIWAGQHTRLDHEAGRQLGGQVGGAVLDALQVHRAGDPGRDRAGRPSPRDGRRGRRVTPAAYLYGSATALNAPRATVRARQADRPRPPEVPDAAAAPLAPVR